MYSKEDKRTRNKVTAIVFASYVLGTVLSVATKTPVFALTTALSVPVCLSKPVKNWILA